MADNVDVMNFDGDRSTMRTSESGGVHTPHHNAQLRVGGSDVSPDNPIPASIEVLDALAHVIRVLANPHWVDPVSGRLRVVLDANGGAQTLGTIGSVTTLTSMSQLGAVPANSAVFDAMTTCWANTVRRAIS